MDTWQDLADKALDQLRAGDEPAAVGQLAADAEARPDDLLREAKALLAQQNLVAARERFEAVLAARPDDAVAHAKLGAIAGLQGDLARAEASYLKARELDPASLDVQAEMGVLAWRRFRDQEAVALLAPVCRAKPANLKLASYLAEAYAALGEDDAIADLLEAALRAGAPWTPGRLMAVAREINVVPACRRGLFRAAARVSGGRVAEHLAERARTDAPIDVADAPEPWRALLAMPAPKRVSACMIVKNEAEMLPRLLASVRPMVDEIVVVDTGSTDDTVAIATSFGARVDHFAWCDDFGAARNASLALATGDWILIADADSEFDLASRRSLRRFLQGPTEEKGVPLAYAIQLADHLSGDPGVVSSRSYFLAIFPNDPELRYVGAIHEQLTDRREPPRKLVVRSINDIVCHHYGYAKAVIARQDKKGRNMRILRREIEVKPEDPFVRYNLALQLRLEAAYDEAVAHVEECLRLCKARGKGFKPPYLESAHILHADLQVRRGDFPAAVAACEEGLKTFPNCPDLLGRFGLGRLATNRPESALGPLEAALRRRGTIGASGSNADFTGWISESLLALAHWRLGDAERCDRHLAHAWETCQNRQAMAERFVTFCVLVLGSPKSAQALLARVGVRLALGDAQAARSKAGPAKP